jgi:transcriptional regulator with XRE-family HTH domain
MNVARLIRHARRAAGRTQRELAADAGVPQSTIARIELGRLIPRADTLDRLLRSMGLSLEAVPAIGTGVDRTQIRELLHLTPGERARLAAADAAALDPIESARRRHS